MLRFIWAHVRQHPARAGTLLLGILVASTGFTVLTGTTEAARLQVTSTVQSSTRAAYDILVRPPGSRTPLENASALVRPNYLSGIFGGITAQQYAAIDGVPGVEVAAPIAMAGYVNMVVLAPLDISAAVDRGADRQIIRLDRTFLADHGLSRSAGRPMYVYVTKHPVSWPVVDGYGAEAHFTGGEVRRGRELCDGEIAVLEEGRPLCPTLDMVTQSPLLTDRDHAELQVVRLLPDGRFQTGDDVTGRTVVSDRLVNTMSMHLPMLLAGIDPSAEDRLVGLRGAVDTGRYLRQHEAMAAGTYSREVPTLATGRADIDSTISVAMSHTRLRTPPPPVPPARLAASLDATPTTPAGTLTTDAAESYRTTVSTMLTGPAGLGMAHLVQTGGTSYDRRPDGVLVARTMPADLEAYQLPAVFGMTVPWQIDDTSFRSLTPVRARDPGNLDVMRIVGTFDPQRVTEFNELSKVPLETYERSGASGADPRSRELLGDQPLRPDGNPAGYLAAPPLLLTTLDALTERLAATDAARPTAPISAIRIRVAGAGDFSAASRERVRVVAQEITARTGLDVDVTYGSSPAPQRVEVSAGRYGRPGLLVTEGWSKKGAATAIVRAVDRKSALLFVLVLVVCALFLVNAVTAAVRGRRAELAILVTMGWAARRIAGVVLGELAVIGLAAGLLSLAVSWPLGAALDIGVGPGRALLAVPVAVGLALLAGAIPAARAARVHPAETLRPAVRAPRRSRPAYTVTAMGLANLSRVPGRTALGGGALAIGIAALTVLVAVTSAFQGTVVGTLLGDAVSLRVRGVDAVAVATILLLGVLAVADVLYLNVRERAAELAALRVLGWTPGAVARLIAAEGFGIGLLGALAGAGIGLAAAASLAGELPPSLLLGAGLVAVAGTVVTAAAALVPALLVHRMSVARALAEE